MHISNSAGKIVLPVFSIVERVFDRVTDLRGRGIQRTKKEPENNK